MTPSQRIERLIVQLEQAKSDRDELLSAVKLIVERWESGDLAEAVAHANLISQSLWSKHDEGR
jgi:hypothetical protein